ncbi:beta-mannosidase [Carboxylicivirga sp. A043]|uniref:glycoside hydrolase family 26 protein n=1 Tax=Carboxylicivirga litoralis TaxID=2816963 RepID=UPI0021CB6154|nr:glycoside hydrolase family 26 protein [Carboxylicivirga sp. A043]MCU4157286.1 beta-mannosidase [Carboxylicivirga sp. A043]
MARISLFILSLFFLIACQPAHQKELSPQEELLHTLKAVKTKAVLFGHQDTYAYGYYWNNVEGNSDVKRVTGDYPAVFGWELGGIEKGVKANLDTVYFDDIRRYAVTAYQQGGINTISWHPFAVIDRVDSWNTETRVVEKIIPGGEYHEAFKKDMDVLAGYLNSIVTPEGVKVPFIFRPWHEMDGTWFWWGVNSCTAEDFKALFRFTVDYLRNEKGVDQMLVAYSPDRNFNTIEEYLTWYPGDEYVDVVGMDNYYDLYTDGLLDEAIRKLHIVIDYANKTDKVSALTETGYENIPDSTWYMSKLGVVLADPKVASNISYTLVWRNDPLKHFFFPYPEHASAIYAKEMLARENVWLLNDLTEYKKTME